MDNVLIDDRRIHVDFSQSVAKIKWKGKGADSPTFLTLGLTSSSSSSPRWSLSRGEVHQRRLQSLREGRGEPNQAGPQGSREAQTRVSFCRDQSRCRCSHPGGDYSLSVCESSRYELLMEEEEEASTHRHPEKKHKEKRHHHHSDDEDGRKSKKHKVSSASSTLLSVGALTEYFHHLKRSGPQQVQTAA